MIAQKSASPPGCNTFAQGNFADGRRAIAARSRGVGQTDRVIQMSRLSRRDVAHRAVELVVVRRRNTNGSLASRVSSRRPEPRPRSAARSQPTHIAARWWSSRRARARTTVADLVAAADRDRRRSPAPALRPRVGLGRGTGAPRRPAWAVLCQVQRVPGRGPIGGPRGGSAPGGIRVSATLGRYVASVAGADGCVRQWRATETKVMRSASRAWCAAMCVRVVDARVFDRARLVARASRTRVAFARVDVPSCANATNRSENVSRKYLHDAPLGQSAHTRRAA